MGLPAYAVLNVFKRLPAHLCHDITAGLYSQLLSLRGWQTAQAVVAGSQEQKQQRGAFHGAGVAVAGLAVAFVAAGFQSQCEASTYAIEPANKPWWSRLLHRADPRQLWQQRQAQNVFLEEMQDDPKVTQQYYTSLSMSKTWLRILLTTLCTGSSGSGFGSTIPFSCLWLRPCQA